MTGISGVVAAGQQWKEIWQVDGNNADGIIATKDGGLLIAQNDKSAVVKLDKNGNVAVAVGKFSFEENALVENGKAVIEAVVRARPATAKGRYLETVTISATMSPGVHVDPAPYLGAAA